MRLAVAATIALASLSARAQAPAQPPATAPAEALAPAAAAGAEGAKKVPAPRAAKLLVFDFAVKGDAAKDLGRFFADAAARELAKLPNVRVLTQADVAAQLGVEKMRVMLGCADDRSCMAEIAGAIDADRTLGGSVVQLGDSWLVSVTAVDARKATTIGGDQETLRSASLEEIVDAVQRLSHFAATGERRETSGAIDFRISESGARVLLDGEEIARGPWVGTRRVLAGSHRVVVAKDGFATWESELRVAAGATTSVAPRLVALASAGPFLRTYLEARLTPVKTSGYETVGADECYVSLHFMCAGFAGTVRAGYNFNRTLGAEVGAGYLSLSRDGLSGGTADTTGTVFLASGVWHPEGSRWLGLALEAGLWKVKASVRSGATTIEAESLRPFGGVEARLDVPAGTFLLGVRGGLHVFGSGEGVTMSPLSVSGGSFVAAGLGVAAGMRF